MPVQCSWSYERHGCWRWKFRNTTKRPLVTIFIEEIYNPRVDNRYILGKFTMSQCQVKTTNSQLSILKTGLSLQWMSGRAIKGHTDWPWGIPTGSRMPLLLGAWPKSRQCAGPVCSPTGVLTKSLHSPQVISRLDLIKCNKPIMQRQENLQDKFKKFIAPNVTEKKWIKIIHECCFKGKKIPHWHR